MDIIHIGNIQYAIPVLLVVIGLGLIYVFSFKSVVEPPFDQLTYTGDDRKPAGKKRKLKEKKSQSNGHATAVTESSSEMKASTTKSNVKAEKSPTKETNKPSAKQQKKQEPSPLKDKPLAKQKDNKNEAESTPKQLKEKKQDSVEKSPAKNNKAAVAKPAKGKGKENLAEEIKNKKNEKNLAKLKKAEGKPPGFDDGGWKEVLSSKDKKSRKKDEPEDIIPLKNVVKVEVTPKKKKTKSFELVLVELTAPVENKEREEEKEEEKAEPKVTENAKKTEKKKPEEKKKSEKQNEKKKKVEQEAQGEKEVDEVDKPEESTPKSKKKSKKKAEDKPEEPTPKPSVKPPELAKVVEIKVVESTKLVVTDVESAAVFDELGDTWKEAKVPKKSKKKVRKDQ